MTRATLSILLAALALLGVGCRQPAYIVAEYGEFGLTRSSGSKSYTEFSIHLETAKERAPAIEVILSDGKTFRCDQLTEETAKKIFAETHPFESRSGEAVTQATHCKHDEASVFFKGGRLTSLSLFEGAKFRKVGQTEFVTLPIEEKEMVRIFGKPKEYRPVYPGKWVHTELPPDQELLVARGWDAQWRRSG